MNLGLEARTRDRLLALALLACVFLAGALAGVVALELRDRPGDAGSGFQRPAPPFRRPPGPPPGAGPLGAGPLGLSTALAERLDLTPDQRERIAAILEQRRERSDAILQEMRPRLEAQLDSSRAEIRALLTPEQRERFDRFVEEGRGLMFRRLERPPPGEWPGRGPRGGLAEPPARR